MTVRAKFYVESIAQRAQQGEAAYIDEVTMRAAIGEDNKEWAKWTPSGELKLQISNPDAVNQFKPGRYVLVTLDPIE